MKQTYNPSHPSNNEKDFIVHCSLFIVHLLLTVLFGFIVIDAQAQDIQSQASTAGPETWGRQAVGTPGGFSNPDTRDWIPYVPHKEDVDAGGILDAGYLIEKPSGAHGFLTQDNKGNFVFEDGTKAKFLGSELQLFSAKEEVDWLMKWMRRHGLNYARVHGFGALRPERYERLDYSVSLAKQEGIYLILTPIYWSPQFNIVGPDGKDVRISSHVILFFNKNMEESVQNLWKDFYTHLNPITGLRYCDDPTIMGIELKNEDSPFWALDWIRNDQPVFWKEIQEQYSDFLKEKYSTTDALRKAWTLAGYPSALDDGESLELRNIEVFDFTGWHVEQNDRDISLRPRKSDQTEFLHKKLTGFYERSYKFLREIGCKQVICGSNWRGDSYTMRHVLEADARMDYVDQHDYFDHPTGGWRIDDVVIHNQSMLKAPAAGLIGRLAPRQVINRPFTVSEWNIGSWNEHVMESCFTMVSIGLLQGWDGLIHNVLAPRRSPQANQIMGADFIDVGWNPSVTLQYPTLARMWHRKDIQEAEPVFIRRISPEQINMPSPIPSKLMPEVFFLSEGDKLQRQLPREDQYGQMLAAVGKIGNEFTPTTTPHYEKEGIQQYLDQKGKIARSMTGEITWDWGQGYLLVNTPKTQGVCGYIGDIKIEAENVQIETTTTYGLVTLTTLDDQSDIKNSKRLLLTALGRARNTGTKYGNAADRDKVTDRIATPVYLEPAHRVAVLELGGPPVITEPVKGKVFITLKKPKRAQVFVLDDLGNRVDEIVPVVNSGKLELNLPGDYKSRLIEIVIEKQQTDWYYWLIPVVLSVMIIAFLFRKKRSIPNS